MHHAWSCADKLDPQSAVLAEAGTCLCGGTKRCDPADCAAATAATTAATAVSSGGAGGISRPRAVFFKEPNLHRLRWTLGELVDPATHAVEVMACCCLLLGGR